MPCSACIKKRKNSRFCNVKLKIFRGACPRIAPRGLAPFKEVALSEEVAEAIQWNQFFLFKTLFEKISTSASRIDFKLCMITLLA